MELEQGQSLACVAGLGSEWLLARQRMLWEKFELERIFLVVAHKEFSLLFLEMVLLLPIILSINKKRLGSRYL